jgi:pyruvate/2-oxoglutarate dehydrogenase complex dihydrolipoamide acyltransferase (E2) component
VETPAKREAVSSGNDIQATPYVRGLIKKFGLDITKIRGTGEGGRILEADVQNLLNPTE